MAIIISENGKNAQKIEESHFMLENNLQEYVKNNPDIVPIYDIQEDAKLLVVAREFRTNSGPIDAVGIDQDGNIYVIETKLYRNSDKRTVLAQALDYGASLWMHGGDASDFIQSIDQESMKQFNVSIEDKFLDFFDTDDAQYIVESITKNLKNGNIKFVILMDQVEDRLKDLITYVNQNSRFDIYAVDLQYFRHDKFEIIIPKLYGAEVKKTVTLSNDDGLRFDNHKILEWLNELNLSWLRVDENKMSQAYLRFGTNYLDNLIPESNDKSGGWSNGMRYFYEIKCRSNGSIGIVLAFNRDGNNPEQLKGQQYVIDVIGAKEKKPDWQWWYVKRFKIDSRSGEDVIRSEIERTLIEEIPKFEKSVQAYVENRNNLNAQY